jgi:hypothetical protein
MYSLVTISDDFSPPRIVPAFSADPELCGLKPGGCACGFTGDAAMCCPDASAVDSNAVRQQLVVTIPRHLMTPLEEPDRIEIR